MKITFAQNDIIAALTAHIANQGIALEGKSVDIKFTMKKGNAGVAADVTIENGLAPIVIDDAQPAAVPQRPALSVVKAEPMADAQAEAVSTEEAKPAETPAADPAPVAQATGTNDTAANVAKPSLFS